MFGIAERVFGSSDEKLVDSYNAEVVDKGDEVLLKPKAGSDRYVDLVLDEEEYSVDSKMTFSKDYLLTENGVVLNNSEVLYRFSEETVNESVELIMSYEQVENLNAVEINRTYDVLDSESDYGFELWKFDDCFMFSISGLYANTPVNISVEFKGELPSLKLKGVEPKTQYFNLSSMKPRNLLFESDRELSAKFRFGMESLRMSAGHESYKLGENETLYCEPGEVEERIERWNRIDYEFEVRPDNYAPIDKTVDEVHGNTMIVEINGDDLTPLASLTVEYPDWVVGIDPRLRYKNIDPSSKYSKREKLGQNKYEFSNVVPDQDLKLFHGGGIGRFENNILSLEGLESSDDKFVRINLVPKRKGILVNSKRTDSINLLIQGQSVQIGGQESEYVEVETGVDTSLKLKSRNNELIEETTIDQKELLTVREITVADDSVNID